MKNKSAIIKLAIAVLLTAVVSISSNLYWLSLYDKPNVRGNHVGLSILSGIITFSLLLLVNKFVVKENNKV